MPLNDPDAVIRWMQESSSRRIANARAAENRSAAAYRSGRFEDYWLELGKEAEKLAEEEYERLDDDESADTDAGDSGTSGGGEPNDGVAKDESDRPREPSEEKLPETVGAG